MDKDLKIEDFEVVNETEPMNGCTECYFYKSINNKMRCGSVFEPIGSALDAIYGDCTEGHHYKLKNKE